MNPEKQYLEIATEILNEIRLHGLALPKQQPPSPSGEIYRVSKPHGIEIWIRPGPNWQLKRNIVYKFAEDGILNILEETRGDGGSEGNRFILSLNPSFDDAYLRHKKGLSISKKLENEKYWIRASFQDEEIHILAGDKEDEEGRHIHLILGKSGTLRVDEKDQPPSDLLEKVVAITTKDGQKIEASLKFVKE